MDIGKPQKVVEVEEPSVPYKGDEVPSKKPQKEREKEPANR